MTRAECERAHGERWVRRVGIVTSLENQKRWWCPICRQSRRKGGANSKRG